MTRTALLLCVFALLLAAIGSLSIFSGDSPRMNRFALAQPLYGSEVRIVAQLNPSGATAVAVQERVDDRWSALLLPSPRVVTADAPEHIWLKSGPLELESGLRIRVVAQRRGNGSIEFGYQVLHGGRWTAISVPERSVVRSPTRNVRFLRSSSFVVAAPPSYVPVGYAGSCQIGPVVRCGTRVFGQVVKTSLSSTTTPGDSPDIEYRLGVDCRGGITLKLRVDGLPRPEKPRRVKVRMTTSDGTAVTRDWWHLMGASPESGVLESQSAFRDIRLMRGQRTISLEPLASDLPMLNFDIDGLLSTPLQANIEHCGNYASGDVLPIPLPHASRGRGEYDGGSGIRFEWSRNAGVRSLPDILLTQVVPAPEFADESEREMETLTLQVSCGSQGVTVEIGGAFSRFDKWEGEAARGVEVEVRWSVDGGEEHVGIWSGPSRWIHPTNTNELVSKWRNGKVLKLMFGSEPQLSGRFHLDLLFDSLVQESMDECLAHPIPEAPPTDRRPIVHQRGGSSYLMPSEHQAGGWNGWTLLHIHPFRTLANYTGTPAIEVTCGIDGLGVGIFNLERQVTLAPSGTTFEVVWSADESTTTESWDIYPSRSGRTGRVVSPPDDYAFFSAIRGADQLTIAVASNPEAVFEFDLGQLGVWDLPVIDPLTACDHGDTEPG